jgi:hypothetical protein
MGNKRVRIRKEISNMKRKQNLRFLLAIVFILLIILSGVRCGKDDNPAAPAVTYNLRDTGPGGGYVFYDKGSYSDSWRYMEAWTADESGTYQWKTTNTDTTGTSTAIGTGYANTRTYMTGTAHPAAEVVRNATYGGKSDWFLPSKEELNKMYVNLWRGTDDDAGNATYTKVGGFAAYYYWSSSEFNTLVAWHQYFDDGDQDLISKNGYYLRVRAVRAF